MGSNHVLQKLQFKVVIKQVATTSVNSFNAFGLKIFSYLPLALPQEDKQNVQPSGTNTVYWRLKLLLFAIYLWPPGINLEWKINSYLNQHLAYYECVQAII